MRENEYRVSDATLGESWFNSSSVCMEGIIDLIDSLNKKYNFDLYNNEEELDEETLGKKISLKYKLVLCPFVEQIEELLKSFLITYNHVTNPEGFRRESAMRRINRQVKQSQQNINGHDLLAMIEYINQHIDNNFVSYIANEYAFIRDGNQFMNSPYSRRSTDGFDSSEDRIRAATQEYTQGFINFRYLFETTDLLHFQPVDTEKIIEYGLAIRSCIGQEISRLCIDHGYPQFVFDDIINNIKTKQQNSYN